LGNVLERQKHQIPGIGTKAPIETQALIDAKPFFLKLNDVKTIDNLKSMVVKAQTRPTNGTNKSDHRMPVYALLLQGSDGYPYECLLR